MTLLAPAWLALLLLAGPLLLLHMRSRRRVRVPSLLLWQGVASTLRPRAALRRPPLSVVLMLQLLALVLVSLLLARPVVTRAHQTDHLILLLDGGWRQNDSGHLSASLEHARRELAVLQPTPAARWSLIVVGERPQPAAVRWTVEEGDLVDALRLVAFSDGEANWEQAAPLAARLTTKGERSRVVLIGASSAERSLVESLLQQSLLPGDGGEEAVVVAWPIPEASGVLIVGASVEPEPGSGSGSWRVRGRVTSTGQWVGGLGQVGESWQPTEEPEPGVARLAVEFVADAPGDRRSGVIDVPVTGGAGEFEALLELAGGGVLTLTPESGYGPPATFVLADQPLLLPVLYVGPGNPPLRRALEATGQVELHELRVASGGPALIPDDAAWALVILEDVSVDRVPDTSTLWLGSTKAPPPPNGLGSTVDTRLVSDAGAVRWNAAHQLVARTDWASLEIGEAWLRPAGPGAVELVGAVGVVDRTGSETELTEEIEFPLVQLLPLPAGLHVNLNFGVQSSDWPQRNGFPLFFRDLLALIDPAVGQQVVPGCTVGHPCQLPAGVRTLTDPAGTRVRLPHLDYGREVTAQAAFVPSRAGVYAIELANGWLRRVAVNAGPDLGSSRDAESPSDTQAGTQAPEPSLQAPWLDLRIALLGMLILVLLAEAWLAGFQASGLRGPGVLLRGATVVLVGLAMFGLRLPLPAYGGSTALIVPGPPWGSGELRSWSELSEDLAEMRSSGAVTVVESGALPADPWSALVEEQQLDLQLDLELALATLPPGRPARVVAVGDGAQSVGDYLHALNRVVNRRAILDVAPRAREPLGETQLVSVAPPPVVLAGDRFLLQVVVHASQAGSAVLTTSREGEVVDQRVVQVRPGSSHFGVEVHEADPGAVSYSVEVRGAEDVFAGNNSLTTAVEVMPPGRVLLVSENAEWGALLEAALFSQGFPATLVGPGQFPTELSALTEYEAVVLANVPAASLSGEQLGLLEEAVDGQGVSLLLLGGESAFGPGGYYETPLERLSPVSSLVPRQAPELAIAFVIDRSNSMRQYAGNEVRLDIAKAAVLRAYDLLPEGARASLIAFDSTARTLVALSGADARNTFREAVMTLEPRGGTAIYPGLEEAYSQLAGSGAASSHVIVMSDGLSQPGDFAGVIALLRAEGVTVSTIGIGPEADAAQLHEIAQLGGGSFHFSADFASLPGIMAHEVLLRTGDLTEERNTVPAWHDSRAPFLRAWPDELPELSGFVPTTLKPEATMHLSVTTEDGHQVPLLASWRYGAGEVVAFASHGAGPWTDAWLELPEFPTLWSHLLRQFARPAGFGSAPARLAEPRTYPVVLDFALADPGRLVAAAAATGGSALQGLAEVKPADSWYARRAPAWPWLLLAALALLFVELTLRYAPDLLVVIRRKER